MACILCQALQRKVRSTNEELTLNAKIRLLELSDSAAAGCSSCKLIRDGIDCFKHRLVGMDRIIENAISVRFLAFGCEEDSLDGPRKALSDHLAIELVWGLEKDFGGIGADQHLTADLKLEFTTLDGTLRCSIIWQSPHNGHDL